MHDSKSSVNSFGLPAVCLEGLSAGSEADLPASGVAYELTWVKRRLDSFISKKKNSPWGSCGNYLLQWSTKIRLFWEYRPILRVYQLWD